MTGEIEQVAERRTKSTFMLTRRAIDYLSLNSLLSYVNNVLLINNAWTMHLIMKGMDTGQVPQQRSVGRCASLKVFLLTVLIVS